MSRLDRRSAQVSAFRARLIPTAAVVLALVAIAFLISGLRSRDDEEGAIPEGMRGVPVAALDLPAYTELQLEHLLDPRTGQLAAVVLPEDSILESTIVDPKQLVGRVLARAKDAARVFREDDFLPIGTRPGLVAGIPAGKRALRIDANKVSGIVGLAQGDRFDLVATYRGDGLPGGVQSVYGGGGSGAGAQNSARSRVISENAAVVSALSTRALPVAGRGEQVVQEMVIALEPEEVPRVTEALELAKRIDCIPRSGRPTGDAVSNASEDLEAEAASRRRAQTFADEPPIVDLIEGDRRSLRRIPEAQPQSLPPHVSAGPDGRSTSGRNDGA